MWKESKNDLTYQEPEEPYLLLDLCKSLNKSEKYAANVLTPFAKSVRFYVKVMIDGESQWILVEDQSIEILE